MYVLRQEALDMSRPEVAFVFSDQFIEKRTISPLEPPEEISLETNVLMLQQYNTKRSCSEYVDPAWIWKCVPTTYGQAIDVSNYYYE